MSEINFINTIKEDCIKWENLNRDMMIERVLTLKENSDSIESNLYSLKLNGHELWHGTLEEINAIVKSMIIRKEKSDFIE